MDFLSKADLTSSYGCQHPSQFARLIGKAGQKILDWKDGKQRFTPKQVRRLHQLIGKPLSKEEKYA
jgi:hypothetical protein